MPVVLHYFDNLPTAAVVTRATRLRNYLAKRMARGEILESDKIVLVGHSTGGLDIRQLVCDLHDPKKRRIPVDGGLSVDARKIRNCLDGVVFLSVPHWGTNVADWLCSHPILRKTAIADLRAAFAGSQMYLLDQIEAGIAGSAAAFTGANIILALRDTLTEANDHLSGQDPTQIAAAQETASDLELYFREMATDFRVINDLTSEPYEGREEPGALQRCGAQEGTRVLEGATTNPNFVVCDRGRPPVSLPFALRLSRTYLQPNQPGRLC